MLRKNAVLACLLALFLAWRGIDAGARLVREMLAKSGDLPAALTLSEDARVRRALRILEAAQGLAAGEEYELYAALRDQVPADGLVFLINKNVSFRRILAFTHMNVLLYPRYFFLAAELPPNWRSAAADMGTRCYIIEHGPVRHPELAAECDRLAQGPGFVLWRSRGSK